MKNNWTYEPWWTSSATCLLLYSSQLHIFQFLYLTPYLCTSVTGITPLKTKTNLSLIACNWLLTSLQRSQCFSFRAISQDVQTVNSQSFTSQWCNKLPLSHHSIETALLKSPIIWMLKLMSTSQVSSITSLYQLELIFLLQTLTSLMLAPQSLSFASLFLYFSVFFASSSYSVHKCSLGPHSSPSSHSTISPWSKCLPLLHMWWWLHIYPH